MHHFQQQLFQLELQLAMVRQTLFQLESEHGVPIVLDVRDLGAYKVFVLGDMEDVVEEDDHQD